MKLGQSMRVQALAPRGGEVGHIVAINRRDNIVVLMFDDGRQESYRSEELEPTEDA